MCCSGMYKGMVKSTLTEVHVQLSVFTKTVNKQMSHTVLYRNGNRHKNGHKQREKATLKKSPAFYMICSKIPMYLYLYFIYHNVLNCLERHLPFYCHCCSCY